MTSSEVPAFQGDAASSPSLPCHPSQPPRLITTVSSSLSLKISTGKAERRRLISFFKNCKRLLIYVSEKGETCGRKGIKVLCQGRGNTLSDGVVFMGRNALTAESEFRGTSRSSREWF